MWHWITVAKWHNKYANIIKWVNSQIKYCKTNEYTDFKHRTFQQITFYTFMVIFPCYKTNTFEREWIVLEATHSSKELHRYSLPGNCAICGQFEVTVNVRKTSTSVPHRCARQRGRHWTGRSDNLAMPGCQPVYTQDNNLHQDCSVPLTRRPRGGRLCEVTTVKKKVI